MEELKENCFELLKTLKTRIRKCNDMELLTEIQDRLEEFKSDYFDED